MNEWIPLYALPYMHPFERSTEDVPHGKAAQQQLHEHNDNTAGDARKKTAASNLVFVGCS